MDQQPQVDYQTSPADYRHWQVSYDDSIATLKADFDEDGGLRPGYALKLNSYDLGVDIELNDALNRIRFEQPQIRCVVITSARDRLFCSGANIFMLGLSSHSWKVNFCKFTNETRNSFEDSSQHSGIKFLAAVNGVCAGGGYELALACDEILLVDDRSSAVSMPEVPLLGVLPGTGGLSRLTDKRKVRHDLADIFCTTVEGVRGKKALDWNLVDGIARPADFDERVKQRALQLASDSDRPEAALGIELLPIDRQITDSQINYKHVQIEIDRNKRTATFLVKAPQDDLSSDIDSIVAQGANWYPLEMIRELDDAVLSMRTNELDIGCWVIKTKGNASAIEAMDRILLEHQDHWLVRETIGMMRRTFSRLDVSSRSLFALIEQGSCFAGTLLELALSCDRIYHLALPDVPGQAPEMVLGETNFGLYPMITGQSRLQRRFYSDDHIVAELRKNIGTALDADAAFKLGLVTDNPDDMDWDDEVRIAIEERVAMSPDALTGMEANLRFNGPENMLTRIFARLSAWQNWVFQRPNAVGEKGALKVYGTGTKANFDWNRV
ncbi:MAG: benzoyl-CoA-dihydrodiol lyase [Parasphingorhabdus sp.]|jgi:benzoyl-CoA-dihydrodiol lyase